jgi:Uncharacterised protein family (UPF0153).
VLPEYERILESSRADQKEIFRQMQHLERFSRTGFDQTVARYHDEVFEKIDCMQCGNCCRSIGPRMRDKDIKIVCKEIGETPKAFAARYLKPDVDPDFYVMKSLPCPFLNGDISCSVYEKRPLSCEEFPYTRMHGVQRHLVRLGYSSQFCPAAALIVRRIIEEY